MAELFKNLSSLPCSNFHVAGLFCGIMGEMRDKSQCLILEGG